LLKRRKEYRTVAINILPLKLFPMAEVALFNKIQLKLFVKIKDFKVGEMRQKVYLSPTI
jgi:hypothetical protein